MTVIARRIITEPVRSASEVWEIITGLLMPESDIKVRAELMAVLGVASSLIASEAIKDAPIIVCGAGPRVRIYGLYGEDAIIGENANESQLVSNPLRGEWSISLPCSKDDLTWIQAALKKRSSHITARDMTTNVDDVNNTTNSAKSAEINTEAFLQS